MTAWGVFLPSFDASTAVSPKRIGRVAQRAEERGFAHLWVGDHLLWNVGMLAPMAVLANVAALTTRIRLGTCVYLLPLRHPVLVAKDVAAVDMLSGGRLILGIGVGGENPLEYEAAGVSIAQRGARTEESIGQLRSLLRQEGVALGGEFVRVPAVTLAPPPVQASIPLWVGGRTQAAVDRAARLAEGYVPVWVSPGRYRDVVSRITERRGTGDGFAFGLNIFVYVGETREAARSVLARHMEAAYRLEFASFEKYAAFGTPEQVAETLSAYRDAGVTDFALNLAGPTPEEQLEVLADVVDDLENVR